MQAQKTADDRKRLPLQFASSNADLTVPFSNKKAIIDLALRIVYWNGLPNK